MLAAADFSNPLVWAILVGWIISVVLHEFAHGIVAYWGGDYTIRERGGLSLNPLQYVDPLFSLILPVIILALGGIPLPGGVTYVRRDLLRSRAWDTAVSLAGPAMNLLLFFACLIALHPSVGWIDTRNPQSWTNAQKFVAVNLLLQLSVVILNLVPVPPLDGFQAIAPYLPEDFRTKATTPPLSTMLFFGYLLVLWQTPLFGQILSRSLVMLYSFGYRNEDIGFLVQSYRDAF